MNQRLLQGNDISPLRRENSYSALSSLPRLIRAMNFGLQNVSASAFIIKIRPPRSADTMSDVEGEGLELGSSR